MTINEDAKDAVEGLRQREFFLKLEDPSLGMADKDTMRREGIEQYLNATLNSVGGQDLGGWGTRIEAELRSGVALPEILSELNNMRRVEGQIDEVGLRAVRRENGYTADGHKLETAHVETAAIDVKPDPITKDTQSAYNAVQSAKTDIGQTVDS